jgi:lysophospholipase L1-like esterase
MLRWIPLLACAGFVVGCSSGASTPTGPSIAGPRLSATRFLAFGDSITLGEVTEPVTGIMPELSAGQPPLLLNTRQVVVPSASYPTQLHGLLTTTYAAQAAGITMVNAGKALEAAQQGVTRIPIVLDQSRPEVVMIMSGVNGMFIAGPDLGAAFVEDMMRSAKAARATVFVGSMVPTLPGRRNSMVVSELEKMNLNLRTAAPAVGAVFVDLYNPMLAEANTLIGPDGLHPTEAGYRRIAELFFAAIKTELEVK